MKQKLLVVFLPFWLLIYASLAANGVWASQVNNIIKIVMIDYPPLMGNNGGLMAEVAKEAFKSQGIETQFHVQPMSRVGLSLSEGNISAVLGTRAWKFQEEVLAISIFYSGMNFFTLKESFPNGVEFNSLSDLKDYHIGYTRGGSLIPIFEKAGVVPDLVVIGDQNVKKLYFNRIDMFASSELAGWGIIEKYYPDKLHEFTMSKKTIHEVSGDIIFQKNQLELIEHFKTGLEHIKKNGTFIKILKGYFKERPIPNYLFKKNY